MYFIGDIEIAENYMMQTREDLESWQKEVQKRLDQESIKEVQIKQSNSGYGSTPRSGYSYGSTPRSGYSSGSSYSEDDDSKQRCGIIDCFEIFFAVKSTYCKMHLLGDFCTNFKWLN